MDLVGKVTQISLEMDSDWASSNELPKEESCDVIWIEFDSYAQESEQDVLAY